MKSFKSVEAKKNIFSHMIHCMSKSDLIDWVNKDFHPSVDVERYGTQSIVIQINIG
jgi:hypothetical protein